MDHSLKMAGRLEPRSGWTAERCTLARTLDVLTTRSAFLLLREAFYGTTRFDDFAQRAALSEPVTSARLKELVEHGLLEREDYRAVGQRTRQCYRLTEKGADLFPALAAMMQWGDRWLDEHGGPVELRHRDCGQKVTVEFRCTAGHTVVADELDLAARKPRRVGTASRG